MSVVVIAASSATLVSLVEAKAHLRVDHGDDDAKIAALLWAAQNEIDGPDGWLGRAVAVQELELRLSRFPACEDIALPCPPLLLDAEHPLSVKYIDAAGAEQTADPSLYSVVTTGLAGVARVALNYGAAWPSPRWQADAVRVRYFAGYPVGDTRAEGIKAAMKLHIEMLYDGQDEAKVRPTIHNLLSIYRIF